MSNDKNTTILGREAILSSQDVRIVPVVVPEWNGTVYVRSLTGAERDSYEAGMLEIRGKSQRVNLQNARARLLCLALCDEKGTRIFANNDVAALSAKNAQGMQRVFEMAQRLSGLTDSDLSELSEGLKNDQSGDSTSV